MTVSNSHQYWVEVTSIRHVRMHLDVCVRVRVERFLIETSRHLEAVDISGLVSSVRWSH